MVIAIGRRLGLEGGQEDGGEMVRMKARSHHLCLMWLQQHLANYDEQTENDVFVHLYFL